MESDLPEGYRGAAKRSSEVGVPECDVGVPEHAGAKSLQPSHRSSDLKIGTITLAAGASGPHR